MIKQEYMFDIKIILNFHLKLKLTTNPGINIFGIS